MDGVISLPQIANPSSGPASGYTGLFAGSDGGLYLIKSDATIIKLSSLNAAGEVLIGTYAKLVPITHGFKIQVSTDGSTWQDGPSWVAS